jgi:hypothetical protein
MIGVMNNTKWEELRAAMYELGSLHPQFRIKDREREEHIDAPALVDRIVIDDPDGFTASYQARQMQHGTAMASTVIHGDLHETGPSLRTRLWIAKEGSP